jgi:pimeloyl-ACP methyl ester carboxylesterase
MKQRGRQSRLRAGLVGAFALAACRLVLLPGLDGTGTLFEPFTRSLGSEVPTTVVDYASPEVSQYVHCQAAAERRLPRNEPYVLVGESFSGPVAVSIAATHPPGLRGLVLVGSFVTHPRRVLRWLSWISSVLPTHRPGWAMDFLLLNPYATPELRLLLRQAMAGVTPRAVRDRIREVARVNVAEELSTVGVPILYLRADGDRLVSKTCADGVARLARRARIAEVRAPHMMLQCAPGECATLIMDFVRGCGTGVA